MINDAIIFNISSKQLGRIMFSLFNTLAVKKAGHLNIKTTLRHAF